MLDTTVPFQAFVKLNPWEAGAGGLAWKVALAGALLGLIAGVIAICRRKNRDPSGCACGTGFLPILLLRLFLVRR